MCKGAWQDQQTDDLTLNLWCEMLAERSFACAVQAVKERIRAGEDRPSLSEVYKITRELEMLQAEHDRESRPKLDAPPEDPKVIARNKTILRNIIAQLSNKVRMP